MLSKVLKGSAAGQVPAMVFCPVAPRESELHPETSSKAAGGSSPPGPDQSALLEKISGLEASLAVAKREAFESGHRQGEKSARAALTPILERMNASIADVVSLRPELRRRAEKDAVDLSLQIARRVLHRELSVDSGALNALARVVFDRLTRTECWQLTVHPQFAEAVRAALPAGSSCKVQVEADPSCAVGTFVVRCPEGAIDASVDSQLSEISRGLTDRLIRK